MISRSARRQNDEANEEASERLQHFFRSPSLARCSPLVEIADISVFEGRLEIPPVREVSLALSHSSHSAVWQGRYAVQTKDIPARSVSLCGFDSARRLELGTSSSFSVILLRNRALEEARQQEGSALGADLRFAPALDDPSLRQLVETLHREKQNRLGGGTLFVDSLAIALATLLVAKYSATFRPMKRVSGGLAPVLLRRITDYMEASLGGELRLEALTREVGLSASHLIRSFRESTGMTPYQFLLSRRVERAKDLMRDPRMSLTQVALATGFADQHHLARTFRQRLKMTPSEYRGALQ